MTELERGSAILRADLQHARSTCNVTDVFFGSGASIYASIQRTLESVDHELVIVTCFWAQSESLSTIRSVLLSLSDKALQRGGPKIRVRICLSSVSILQKLFHTQSQDGFVYPSSQWTSHLHLPGPEELLGLDLEVKSIFIKPFCVMHPKFIIVDRQRVLLPSCNVSWENWFEGCICLSGDVVNRFVAFWKDFWRGTGDVPATSDPLNNTSPFILPPPDPEEGNDYIEFLPTMLQLRSSDVPCMFLPSQHHINPHFRLPWQRAAPPPATPLNTFLLAAFRTAKEKIHIVTPNLTSPPVLAALLHALKRGVEVNITTSERLMILEQLVTAGTTTARCIKTLIKRYERARTGPKKHLRDNADLERGLGSDLGVLAVYYYTSDEPDDPVQSHLKMTVVDDELLVLGSGNMDRASWYTSQELGIALFGEEVAQLTRDVVERLLEGRSKKVYRSDECDYED